VADRRNATEWPQPEAFIEEPPHRPAPIADAREWKYVSICRLPAFIGQSIDHGLQWVVLEPNDERLCARVREQVEDFQPRSGATAASPVRRRRTRSSSDATAPR
jgi:hypothetical protein